MSHLMSRLTTHLSQMALFVAAVVLAGLGFAIVGTLAVFGLAALGIAVLVSPFVGRNAAPEDASV